MRDGWFGQAAAVVASSLLAGLALTNQSLWIDEANSALKAVQPSLASWWQVLTAEKGSDLQMPVYMFYLWLWEKVAGHSEFALRAANVPWLVVAQWALYRAARGMRLTGVVVVALSAVNPFLWFYLNEARPYVMQYAASACVAAGLAECSRSGLRRGAIWLFVSGVVLLAGSSMLGMAWSGSALLVLGFVCLRKREWPDAGSTFLAVIALALLGGFYIWTLASGARGSAAGTSATANLLFVLYELFGFAGLGPGRLDLRERGLASFGDFPLPLIVLVIPLLILVWFGARVLLARSPREPARIMITYAAGGAAVVIALGFGANFRLLGRHFTPVSPVLCLWLAAALSLAWQTRWRLLPGALVPLWLCSAVLLRVAPRHAKDDYREAARFARNAIAGQQSVWWAADRAAAIYYDLPVTAGRDVFGILMNPSNESLAAQPPAAVIVLSKPDIYDAKGAVASHLRAHHYKLVQTMPAFAIWQRP